MDPKTFNAILLLIAAAIVGIGPTLFIELFKRRHDMRTRWDKPLLDWTAEFTEAARRMLHALERLEKLDRAAEPKIAEEYAAELEENHRKLRATLEKIHLLGTEALQETSGQVVHHAWAARAVAEGRGDPHVFRYPERPAVRLRAALDAFYREARSQLGVKKPTLVIRLSSGRRVDDEG